MNLNLTRVCTSEKGTFGVLTKDGEPICVTCEDPWKDNQRRISCIPEGEYQCRKHNGLRYVNVWEITNVPNRSAILIHSGNTTDDTEGCILVGNGFSHMDGNPAVINSLATLNELRKTLPDEFTLTVRSAYGL